jgi:hypothetical protein
LVAFPRAKFWVEDDGQAPKERRPPFVTQKEGIKIARHFRDELMFWHLEVFLVPADEQMFTGHMKRKRGMRNADWYRDFCDQYQTLRGKLTVRCDLCWLYHRRGGNCRKGRRRPRKNPLFKSDTMIKRRETLRALDTIIEGGKVTPYVVRLRDFIRSNGRRHYDAAH